MMLNPFFNDNEFAITLNCSNEFLPYLDVCLKSIQENSNVNNFYDVVILESSILDKNKEKFYKAYNCNNFQIRFYNPIEHIDIKDFYCPIKSYSKESYYKLVISKIFCNYKKVLYIDADIVFKCDINELSRFDLGENPIGMTRDFAIAFLTYCDGRLDLSMHIKNSIELEDSFDYYSAGVILFNIKKISDADVENLLALACNNKFWLQEQDIFNLYFKNKIYDIPYQYCLNIPFIDKLSLDFFKTEDFKKQFSEALANPKVLHYSGSVKPWNTLSNNIYDNYWWEYAAQTEQYVILLNALYFNSIEALKDEIYDLKSYVSYCSKPWQYYKYKFLSKIILGTRKKRYQEKYKKFKQLYKCIGK